MTTISFGVLVRDGNGWVARLVPIDNSGQAHLESMFAKTEAIVSGATVHDFELAEKYDDHECAKLSLDDALAHQIKTLYDAGNIATSADALYNLDHVIGYFGIISQDGHSKRLGLRQARTFKSLRNKGVWTLSDGQLTIDDRPKFTLSDSWEIQTKDGEIYIVSATALERICDLAPQIRASAIAGIDEIAPQLTFLDMEPLRERVEQFTRSARIVADIRKRGDLTAIEEARVKSQSDAQGIEYEVIDGKYIIKKGHEEALLMLMDRRRYADPLVTENPDVYEADSRRKVAKGAVG